MFAAALRLLAAAGQRQADKKGDRSMLRYETVLLCLCIAPAGCGGGAASTSPPATAEIKRRDPASLPEVGDYLPPLDEGRLRAAPPAGWNVMRRGRTYLVGFAQGKTSELPRIVIDAADPPPGTPSQLTAENAAAFAAQQDKALHAAAKAGKKRIEEFNLPIVLGETAFIRHVRQATLADAPCVIQSLQTIQNGRLYTIELVAEIDAARAEEYERSLTKWRDYGYAVAAHLQFAAAGERFDPLVKPESGK
jgi:hypothetical protein